MKLARVCWIYLAMLIAIAGVIIHVGAIFGGPAWFAFFGAPPSVVASARNGTWLAPVSALVIAGLMALCALYAACAVGLVRRVPLLRLGLAGMATVCLVRALLLPVLAVRHPELRNTFEAIGALIWGVAGIGLALGSRIAKAGH